jgi:penicillin-binding protein 2
MARVIPAYYYEQLIADKRNPLLNLAVGAELPAGSVFKLVTATGGLNEGIVTPEEIIKTPGKITVNRRYYANDPGQPRFVDWITMSNPDGLVSWTSSMPLPIPVMFTFIKSVVVTRMKSILVWGFAGWVHMLAL